MLLPIQATLETRMRKTAPTPRTRVRRSPEYAHYDRQALYDVIDAAHLCHIAFHDGNSVHSLPVACWRVGGYLHIHGSTGSRLMQSLCIGMEVSVSICHFDGLVLARSAFNHSMNYRSAVIYGCFTPINDETAKLEVLDHFMERLAPGRLHEIRNGNRKELGATIVLRLPLAESAVKIRTGGPIDDDKDMDLPAWAGVLPVVQMKLPAIAEPGLRVATPDYVQAWTAEAYKPA